MQWEAVVVDINCGARRYLVDGLDALHVVDGDLYVHPCPGRTSAIFGRGCWMSAEVLPIQGTEAEEAA